MKSCQVLIPATPGKPSSRKVAHAGQVRSGKLSRSLPLRRPRKETSRFTPCRRGGRATGAEATVELGSSYSEAGRSGISPPPTRIRLDFRRQRAGVHDKTSEFHHPGYRVVRQQLSPREFRIEMLHLQKLPDLLSFVAERALGDAGELAKLIARHEDILGSIEQEINAADDVERRSGPDPQVPAR